MSGFSKSEIDALFKQYGRENDPRKEIISNLLENTLDETGKIKKIFKYDPNSSGSSLKDFPSLAVAYIEYIFRATTLQQLQSLHGSLHGEEAVKYNGIIP